ncbi:protein SOGA3a [Aplochiton taeniatus]
MWNAFGNGSGLHGGSSGGGGGGGYVPAQGWEFVPCSRLEKAERGRGKSRSPLRRISSPPSICQIFEPPPQPGAGGGTQFEGTRGQYWPGTGPELAAQLKQQQGQLKKKIEDLKRRHGHDKEDWMREKEILLRQVADIQGGENRRILLDLKAVLEEVQTEVKREEEKRSDLQLLYTKDRCAWELEKAELKCRIAQTPWLSAGRTQRRGIASLPDHCRVFGLARVLRSEHQSVPLSRTQPGLDVFAVLAVPCPRQPGGRSSLALRCPLEPRVETTSLRREREEQRRLLADTHTAAMDLRCRLDHNERGWVRERSELLERFDSERKEWESQLKDMQRKIEELYSEVRTRREGGGGGGRGEVTVDSERAFPPISRDRDPRRLDEAVTDGNQEAEDTAELEAFLQGVVGLGGPKRDATSSKRKVNSESVAPQGPHGVPLATSPTVEVNYGTGSEKKKNTTALNAALKEIARVSEELCSYQDEIRKKAGGNRTDSLYFSEENEALLGRFKSRLEMDDPACDLNQIYDDLRALERENWIVWSPSNTLTANGKPTESWRANSEDLNTKLPESESQAPPIPPRVSSWYLSSPTPPEQELGLRVPEPFAGRKCHSPCLLVDRKSSSPSIVRKFEAMLQENEGKVLTGGMVAHCSVPANSKCNAGCCHSRWSCDGSRLAKPSSNVPVQKSRSECNILNAGTHCSSLPPSSASLGGHSTVDLLLPSLELELPRAQPPLQGSRRNLLLEQKTAEFNRTLFHAEMGRGLEDEAEGDGGAGEVARNQDATFDLLSQCTEAASDMAAPLALEVARASSADLSPLLQEVKVARANQLSRRKDQEVKGQEVAHSDLSPQVRLREEASPAPNRPSRQPQPSVGASVTSHAEQSLPASSWSSPPGPQPSHTQEERTLTARTGPQVPPAQQPMPEPRSRHPGHPGRSAAPSTQPDPPRPGPRVLADHPWKPLTLAAYPRPAEARSNYGAVERILKSYEESAAWARQNQENRENRENRALDRSPTQSPKHDRSHPKPSLSQEQEEEFVGLLDMLDMDPPLSFLPGAGHTHTSSHTTSHTSSSHTHTSHTHLLQTSVAHGKTHLTVKESKASSSVISSSSSSVQKNFSRPACPANRRLPSRWASRSPSSSSSTSSSPSSTPVTRPSVSPRPTSAFNSYSSAYQTETVII